MSNVVTYTGEGGSVTVRARAEADTVVVTVADTGVGIDPAFQGPLCDPFEQSAEGSQQNEGGTGLGLAITQRLASLMGGSIEVESTPGEGLVFTLRLPRWAHDGEAGYRSVKKCMRTVSAHVRLGPPPTAEPVQRLLHGSISPVATGRRSRTARRARPRSKGPRNRPPAQTPPASPHRR